MAFSDSKPHYALLDGLRGVAALAVVWCHIFEGYQFAGQKPFIEVVNHGYLAVDFFFILSGFVIGYAYDDRWGRSLTLKGFFRRRLIRLHPMVIMGGLLGALSFTLTGFERWDGTHATLGLTLLAMVCCWLMLPAVPGTARDVRGNGEMFPLNGPFWSLFYEYIGNVAYALIIRRLPTRVLAALSCLLCMGLAWYAITDHAGYGSICVGWTLDQTNALGGILRMLCPMTMGMLLSRVFRPVKVRGAFWLCTVVLLLIFHVPHLSATGTVTANGLFESACIIIVFPLLVWLAASGKTTDATSTRVCRFLGDISFPLYLVHYPLMYAFYLWLIHTGQCTFAQTWPVALCVIAASVLLAWVCLRFYDIPVRKWLTRLCSKQA